MSPSKTNLTALNWKYEMRNYTIWNCPTLWVASPNRTENIVVQPKAVHRKIFNFYLQDKLNILFFYHLSFTCIYLWDM